MEANFECLCAGVKQKGSGVVANISRSGALIENTTVLPDRGELVGLCLEVAGVGCVVLVGRLVRQTFKGFAIEFDHLDARAAKLVDSVAAILRARHTPRR